MSLRDEKSAYEDPLKELELPDLEGAEDADFSLEEILAEYGGGREKLLKEVAEAAVPELDPEALPQKSPDKAGRKHRSGKKSPPEVDEIGSPLFQRPEEQEGPVVRSLEEPPLEEALPRSPQPISLQEVVSDTVDAVLEENSEPLLKKRRGLFSRRKLEETEDLYETEDLSGPEMEEEAPQEEIGEEPPLEETAEVARAEYKQRSRWMGVIWLLAVLPFLPLAAEEAGYAVPYWTGEPLIRTGVLLGGLLLVMLMTREVAVTAWRKLRRRRCTGEVIVTLSAVVAALDCASCLLLPERSAATPYAPVSAMALAFAQWGLVRESLGRRETFRTAAMDPEPPYLVTETERGACKQVGSVRGFDTTARKDDAATLLQSALLPVVLGGTVVFAGLSSLGQGRGSDFLLNWSAILAAAGSFALPLCWSFPWSRLAVHLQRAGCAVAGYCGAEKVSGRKGMILADTDLFPPGTIQLNGVKVFGEELRKAASYAATLSQAAGSGLHRLFDGLVRSECGQYEEAQDFSFYEEGGYSATIRGEAVLMGTASFLRKMEVRLPPGINLKTGIFLAVDRQVIAVFAVKYNASENVDFALRMMRRSHITPILAARDPNITPALLKRKFHKGVKVEYPDLTARVALSEAELDRGLPRVLLFREGLLPYAEAVVGSRRLCKSVRRGAGLSVAGSAAGALLAFYLVFLGAYSLMTPLTLLVFLLLWVIPVLLLGDWVSRY